MVSFGAPMKKFHSSDMRIAFSKKDFINEQEVADFQYIANAMAKILSDKLSIEQIDNLFAFHSSIIK